MTTITIHYGDWGPPVTVTQTDPPSTWELNYPKAAAGDHRRILKAAEHAVLHAGGDRVVVGCPPEQHDLCEQLERWPTPAASKWATSTQSSSSLPQLTA